MVGERLSEVGTVRRLVLGHPKHAFRSDRHIRSQWRSLNYLAPPHYGTALVEYDRFVDLLQGLDIELSFLRPDDGASLDAIYVRDAAIEAPRGAILANMGKLQRQAEPACLGRHLEELGVPVRGAIEGEGRLEGGDVVWFDDRTVAVGRGYRTNEEGIRQLRALLGGDVDELVEVPLPHWRGPDDVFHLMSILSPIDDDLALVYSPLMPVPFREWLLGRGMSLIEVPEAEFGTMACNVLALAPRRCVTLAGNPRTRALLEAEGVRVHEIAGEEISLKGGGGPTCLTRPIARAAPSRVTDGGGSGRH